MEYSNIDKEQQEQILKGRLAAWEADHYGHTINLAAFDAVKNNEGVETSQKALAVLSASIEAGRKLLNDLTAESAGLPGTDTSSGPE